VYRPAVIQHPLFCFWAPRPPGSPRTSPDPAWPRCSMTKNLHGLRGYSGAQLNRRDLEQRGRNQVRKTNSNAETRRAQRKAELGAPAESCSKCAVLGICTAIDAHILGTLSSALIAPLRFNSPPDLLMAPPRGESCGLTPNSETRSPQPAPPASCVFGSAPHSEAARPPRFRAPLSHLDDAVANFGLRISAFFRPSTFGLRTLS
jgi:hypothetical protein